MNDLVVTLIGRDRPGLVEAVAQAVAEQGGNWLESRMIHLAGKFAGILRIEVASDRRPALERALGGLVEAAGLKLVVEAGDGSAAAPATRSAAPVAARARSAPGPSPGPSGAPRMMEIDLLGLDRPGLVREISQLLAQHGVNVEELSTDRSTAAMSGDMMFHAEARVKVPAGLDAAHLRAAIERLANDLSVEIRLEEETP